MGVYGRASVSRTNPRAFGVCDRCGFLYNRDQLEWQFDWRGSKLQNLRILVCRHCLDAPQEQLRAIILPADPVPIDNPRQEQYTTDDNPISSIGTSFGNMTNMAGLAAAFDGNVNKPLVQSCALNVSLGALGSYAGRYYTSALAISSFTITAPNDVPFLRSGAVAYAIQGANQAVGFASVYTGTTAGTVGESITATVTNSPSYLYWRVAFTGDGTQLGLAQFEINAT